MVELCSYVVLWHNIFLQIKVKRALLVVKQ